MVLWAAGGEDERLVWLGRALELLLRLGGKLDGDPRLVGTGNGLGRCPRNRAVGSGRRGGSRGSCHRRGVMDLAAA